MADMRVKFLATSVQMQMHLAAFLPDEALHDPAAIPETGLKTLWLLHDGGGDCSDWQRLSMVEHYARQAGLALVAPNLDNSMYMDMAHGGYPYFRYLSEDLPSHVRNLVRLLSPRREDNFVAGVGVGGYGALKWALRFPEMFCAAASFSGPLDIAAALRHREACGTLPAGWAAAFGDPERLASAGDDILSLAAKTTAEQRADLAFHLATSARDDSFDDNGRVARSLTALGFDVCMREEADRSGWPFWDECIRAFIGAVAPACRNGGR